MSLREPHPALIWRPAPTFGYELVIDGFGQPLGRAVPLRDGKVADCRTRAW